MTVRHAAKARLTPEAVAEQLAVPAARLFPAPAQLDPVTGLAVGDTRTPYSDYFEELCGEVYRLSRIDDPSFAMAVAEILGVSPAHWYRLSIREGG